MTQTAGQYPTLSLDDESKAYAAIKDHFNLKAKQRDLLDAAFILDTILLHAHLGEMDVVGGLLFDAGVIGLQQMVDAG